MTSMPFFPVTKSLQDINENVRVLAKTSVTILLEAGNETNDIEFLYCDDSMSTLSSSGSRIFSQKVEADSSPDVRAATSISAGFD